MRKHLFNCAILSIALLCAFARAEEKPATKDVTVYVTKTGEKYHLHDCLHAKDATAIPLADARKYEPCKVCKPDATVYVTATGGKFHMKECQHAGKDAKTMTAAEALSAKLEACKVCNPPTGKKEKEMKDGEGKDIKKEK